MTVTAAATSDSDIRPLPQYGFGEDHDFGSLIKANRFLFRVYTPKETSVAGDTDAYFIAPKFNDQVARSPLDLPEVKFSETVVGTYAEVARHMQWTTKSSSCYISASFSFAWAVWEAVKRYHIGVKKDVQIAIIDSSALGGRAATAVQLLMKSTLQQRDQDFWKWHRFADDSQTVLVYGMVPRQAVLASIPLLQILRKLPSYFLRKDVQVINGNPLDQVAWNYTSRKLGYRQFCKEMSTRFLNCPDQVKMRDSTGGAVRLALSFLRPFFHQAVQDDLDIGISYLRLLAISISDWPGDGWARNYPEITQIVESMALALGEELRDKYGAHREEINRLQLHIYGLETTIKDQNQNQVTTLALEDVEVDSDGDFEVEFGADDPTLVIPLDPQDKETEAKCSLKMSIAVLPRIPVSFQTPITPPESPRNSLLFPRVTIPDSGAVSQVTLNPLSPEKPASPPPISASRSPVFSPPKPNSRAAPTSVDEKCDSQTAEDENELSPSEAVLETSGTQEDDDDDELTEPGDDDVPASVFSSPRSSIISVETLCDSVEVVPGKRRPFSRTHSLDLFGKQSPFVSMWPSRTVSFSEPPGPLIPFAPAPTTVGAVDPLSIPLPPSPAPSLLPSPISNSLSESSLSKSSLSDSDSSLHSPVELEDRPSSASMARPDLIIIPKRSISLFSPLSCKDDGDDECDSAGSLPSALGVTETASYIVTGFLVGAFLTLFLFSTQRRTLLYAT